MTFHHFLIAGTQRVDMEVVGTSEVKMFCKDYVESATVMFILSTIACFVVIVSLVLHRSFCNLFFLIVPRPD